MGGKRVAIRPVLVAALLAAAVTLAPNAPVAADGNEAPGGPAAFRSLTAGGGPTCAILADGSVRCWGSNAFGSLGLGDTSPRGDAPNEMGAFLPAVPLGTGRTATAITAGNNHTCALLDNNTVKCWGNNFHGKLGLGDSATRGDEPNEMGDNLPAVDLGTGRTATAVAAGENHTCAVLDNGTVKCWGLNSGGQLGLGDTEPRGGEPNEMGDKLPAVDLGTGRTATAIMAGFAHTCAVLDNGTVKCWGLNSSGQLGQGSTTNLGANPNEMGDNLPPVSLGTGRTATAITGYRHTCALLDNATVKCWGQGGGQLGQGDNDDRGNAPNEMGNALPAVDLGTGRTATAVAAGGGFTCARLDDNTVKCWGSNSFGQLGLGDTDPRGDEPNEMGDKLPPVSLGTGRTATAVTAGGLQACARLDDNTTKCWGFNSQGQLGQEDTAHRGNNANEMGNNLATVFLPPAGLLNGTVRDADSNAPIPGAMVVALRTSDFGFGASAIADANGDYTMSAPAGNYFYYLLDPAAAHDDGFFGAPLNISVVDGGNLNLPLTMEPIRGAFSGTVTDQGTGQPIGSVQVYAIGGPGLVASATTAGDGTYTVTGLPPGTYHAVFADGLGRRIPEYWPNSPDFAGSDPFNVTAGDTTTGIDGTLLRP